MRSLFLTAGLAALVASINLMESPYLHAQRTGSAHFGVSARSGARALGSSRPAQRSRPGYQSSARSSALLYPFGLSDLGYDDPYASGYPVAAEPPMMLMPALRREEAGPETQGRPPQSLLIELQGDRYVRLRESETNEGNDSDVTEQHSTKRDATKNTASADVPRSSAPARELSPAILVFRDGHHEEIRDYAIADGMIYARGNYYTDGYWNKTIALSALDVRETVASNATRGVTFQLPTAPNEVVTRP